MVNHAGTAVEEALLLELAELGMGVARQLHQAVLATTDTTPLLALATAYHTVSRGVRQSLALRARFAAGTLAPERATRAEAAQSASTPRPEVERPDDYERPDWNERVDIGAEPLDVEHLHDDLDVCRTRIRRDLTVVSRTPALANIPALRPHAAALAARAALLGGAALRVVDSS